MERTLSIVKPDGVSRGLIGKVVKRLEANDLKIIAMKMIHMTRKQAEGFYAVHRERPFFGSLTDFMTSEGLVTAPAGTSLDDAVAILHRHRIEKLPLVDLEGRLTGLITVKDITKRIEKPMASLDDRGRLRVAAAVGVTDTGVFNRQSPGKGRVQL